MSLRAGSKGPDVANLQLRLRRLGLYEGRVNGLVGPLTVAAVKKYERAHGLKVDGFVSAAEELRIKKDSLRKTTRAGLERGDSGARVKDVQHDLAGLGFFKGRLSGRFDAATAAAVKKYERSRGLRPDGIADLKTERLLDAQRAKVDAQRHPNVKAPPDDYRRVRFRGETMNVRTQVLLKRAETYWKGGAAFNVTQGSYTSGVAASAGTHDGGGALDLSVRGKSQAQINQMVKALRQAGFAAWQRTPADGFSPHIHAIAIGDRQAARLAKSQVQSYFAGRSGLSGNGPDRNRNVGRPYPRWAKKFD